jgi:hypothetical protein
MVHLAPDIAAMDPFLVPTIGFDLLYAFIIVRLDRRDLVSINVTARRCALYLRSLRAFARRRPAPPLFASMNSKARFTTSSVARLSLCTLASSCLAVALSPALRTIVHSCSSSSG